MRKLKTYRNTIETQQALLSALDEYGKRGATVTQLVILVDRHENTVRRQLKLMAEKGLTQYDRGFWSKV